MLKCCICNYIKHYIFVENEYLATFIEICNRNKNLKNNFHLFH